MHSYKIGYKFLLPTQTFKSRYRISSSSPIKIIDDFIGHIKTGKFELDFRTEIEKGYSIEIKQVHSNIIYIYLNKDYSIEGKNVNDIVEIDPTLTISSATTEICGEITAYDTVIIDRGRKDKIEKGMIAISGSGIAGRVIETGWRISRVLLVTDYNSVFSGVIERTRDEGAVSGNMRAGLIMKYLDLGCDVKKGDKVITSGLYGVFEKGILPPLQHFTNNV